MGRKKSRIYSRCFNIIGASTVNIQICSNSELSKVHKQKNTWMEKNATTSVSVFHRGNTSDILDIFCEKSFPGLASQIKKDIYGNSSGVRMKTQRSGNKG